MPMFVTAKVIAIFLSKLKTHYFNTAFYNHIICYLYYLQGLGKWVRPKKTPVGFLALGFSHAKKKQMKTYQTAEYNNAILNFVTTM